MISHGDMPWKSHENPMKIPWKSHGKSHGPNASPPSWPPETPRAFQRPRPRWAWNPPRPAGHRGAEQRNIVNRWDFLMGDGKVSWCLMGYHGIWDGYGMVRTSDILLGVPMVIGMVIRRITWQVLGKSWESSYFQKGIDGVMTPMMFGERFIP